MSNRLIQANDGGKVHNIKLVLLGDSGVGKSSIARNFVVGEFIEDSKATVGVEYFTRRLNIPDHNFRFEIWDTAGAERYHSLAPMYYRGAQAAIVVYDITDKKLGRFAQSNDLEYFEASAKTSTTQLAKRIESGDILDYKNGEKLSKEKNQSTERKKYKC